MDKGKGINWIILAVGIFVVVALIGLAVKEINDYNKANRAAEAGIKANTKTLGKHAEQTMDTTPAVAATWQTVYDVSGSEAAKITPAFALGDGEKRILYNYAPIDNYSGVFAAYVMEEGTSLDANGGSPDAQPQVAGAGETRLIRDAGMYHIEIIGPNCSWQVTVQERR